MMMMKMMMMMMKGFLFLTFCLIKGHMGDDVTETGITGGSVIINCMYKVGSKEGAKSFCKVSGRTCTTLTEPTDNLWIPEEKFSMTDNKSIGFISVLIRNLTVNDKGEYRCKSGSEDLNEVKLDVEQEACCGRSEQTAYALGTAVIRCRFPEIFHDYPKQLFKVHNGSLQPVFTYRDENKDARFSLNMNSQEEHVFTVTVTKVSRHDDGVYFCGAHSKHISYSVLFTEIQLHVTDLHIIVAVSVCVILLFAGGLGLLLLKLRCKKTDGSASDAQRNTRDDDEITSCAAYATIQDSRSTAFHPSAQKPIGLKTVYAMAHLPTMTQNTTQS